MPFKQNIHKTLSGLPPKKGYEVWICLFCDAKYYAIEEENIFLKFKSNFISSEFVRELLACYNSEPQNFFCQKLHFFTAAAESEEPCANFIFAKFKHIFTLLFL